MDQSQIDERGTRATGLVPLWSIALLLPWARRRAGRFIRRNVVSAKKCHTAPLAPAARARPSQPKEELIAGNITARVIKLSRNCIN
jgi:hypothetical protein